MRKLALLGVPSILGCAGQTQAANAFLSRSMQGTAVGAKV
jgi:hypothetical protein